MAPSSACTSAHASNQKNNAAPLLPTNATPPLQLGYFQYRSNLQQKVGRAPKGKRQIGKNLSLCG